MPMAKQVRTRVPQSHTRICNEIHKQRRFGTLSPPAARSTGGIRTVTREYPIGSRMPRISAYLPVQLHFDASETS